MDMEIVSMVSLVAYFEQDKHIVCQGDIMDDMLPICSLIVPQAVVTSAVREIV